MSTISAVKQEPKAFALLTVSLLGFLAVFVPLASSNMDLLAGLVAFAIYTAFVFTMRHEAVRRGLVVPAFIIALALAGGAMALVSIGAQAQSVSIAFDAGDLDVFFTWFNTMFQALLPIGLLGAGLAAGGAFVFVIGNMLKNAFQSII